MSKKTKQKEQAIAVQPFDRDQKEKGKALRAWRQHRTYKRLMWLTMIIPSRSCTGDCLSFPISLWSES